MNSAKSVLIFEYISGGGTGKSDDFEFLIPEGFGMLSSLISDFSRFGFLVHTLVDSRITQQFVLTHSDLIKKNQLSFTEIYKEEQFSRILNEIIPKFDCLLFVAPEFSNILSDLVGYAEKLMHPHQTILNLPSNAISIFTDKLQTGYFLSNHGFNSPKSLKLEKFIPISEIDGLEYIIKPVDGVGASNTYNVRLKNEPENINPIITQLLKKAPKQQFLIQKSIPGIPLSAFICSQKGIITFFTINSQLVTFTPLKQYDHIQQIEYLGGITPFTELSPQVMNTIREVASLISSQFHLTGFIGIDFIFNKKTNCYSIVDINPRVTTPYIAISELFRENNNNIVACLFSGKFNGKIVGTKSFKKTDLNTIALE